MKTVLLLAFVALVGAENLRVPSFAAKFPDFKKLSNADKVKHVRDNCPEHGHKKDADILANLAAAATEDAPGDATFTTGFTCMSVFSKEEFKGILKTRPSEEAKAHDRPSFSQRGRRATTAPPASVDWRTKGYVNAVKNQGQCGSCWTFSANAAMEGAIFKKTAKLPNLSEQNLVDCVTASSGCNGGWMTDAYDYSIKNLGTDNQTSYAYTATQNPTCKYVASGNAGKVASYAYTNQDDEVDLKAKLATIGPIAVAIDATNIQSYTGGIFKCTTFTDVNHGVVVVGYGTDTATATDYYIVRNSWGPNWGEQGYIRIVRNKGSSLACGIPTYANYPVA